MGAAFTSQQSVTIQNINNDVLNASTSTCTSTCSAYNGGNTVIINGTTINGNVTFNQTCDLVATCTINSQLNTNVSDIIKSLQNQSSITANGFPDFSLDGVSQLTQAQQNITTSIANIIESSCQSSSILVNQDNFTYLNNSTVNGSLTFSQAGNVNSNCTLNNISTVTVANQESASTSQSSVIASPLAFLVVAIILIAIVIFVIFIINFLFKGAKGGGGKSSAPSTNTGLSSSDINNLTNALNNPGTASASASAPASSAGLVAEAEGALAANPELLAVA